MKAKFLLVSLFRLSLAISIGRGLSLFERDTCLPPPWTSIHCGDACHGACYCQTLMAVTAGPPVYFNDWDFKLSAVVQGPASVKIDNSIKIPTTWNVVPQYPTCYSTSEYESAIGGYLKQDTGKIWNVYDDGTSYSIPAGQYGILVINPWTEKTSGTAQLEVDPKCPHFDSCYGWGPTVSVPYTLDTRQQNPSLGPGINVGGVISLITSPTLPIPCRIGKCSHS